jgi:hypothetical protein
MKLDQLLHAKKVHAARLANQRGADGESQAIVLSRDWRPRPKGHDLKMLLSALAKTGANVKPSSFDAIALPDGTCLDFTDEVSLLNALPLMCFVEIKSSSQARVKPGFEGFFFALTEGEISAAESLGTRHRVALHNKLTGEVLLTSVPEILSRAKSMNWQLSVQL